MLCNGVDVNNAVVNDDDDDDDDEEVDEKEEDSADEVGRSKVSDNLKVMVRQN